MTLLIIVILAISIFLLGVGIVKKNKVLFVASFVLILGCFMLTASWFNWLQTV